MLPPALQLVLLAAQVVVMTMSPAAAALAAADAQASEEVHQQPPTEADGSSANATRSCNITVGIDCPEGDLAIVTGFFAQPDHWPIAKAEVACCQLCAANSSCAVAVLAINNGGACMLKSTAHHPCVRKSDRLLCVPSNKPSPTLPTPAPPPPGPPPAPPRIPVPANNKNIVLHGCLYKDLLGLPFCNTTLSFTERAADLRGRLTLEEKIRLLTTPGKPTPRLGLPGYEWGVEDDHGSGTGCLNGADGKPRCPTMFPTLSIVAASFNETLAEAIGFVIGTEMRAANNAGATRARWPSGATNSNPPIGVNGWGRNTSLSQGFDRN